MGSRFSFYSLYCSRLINHSNVSVLLPKLSLRVLSSSNSNTSPDSNGILLNYNVFLRLTSFKPFISSFFERYVFNSKSYTYSIILDISNFYSFYLIDLFLTFIVPAVSRRSGSSFQYGRTFYDVSVTDISLLPYFGSYSHNFAFHLYFNTNSRQLVSLFQLS